MSDFLELDIQRTVAGRGVIDMKAEHVNIKNKRARFDYEISDTYVAGIVLTGTEIKSIRDGKASLVDTYCMVENGEVWVKGMNISEYFYGSYNNHEARRDRKLLLNKKEIQKLAKAAEDVGFTIVPMRVFINERGLAKMQIGVGRGKNIYDFLEMTVNQAIEFLSESNGTQEKRIIKKLQPLKDVGLGYIKLGQSSSTLSGGENQRVKLAYYISLDKHEHTMFIFDEPTTGLHFHDISTLLKSLNRLVEKGNTVIIIEHNMDVIKSADWLIDIGPEGGDAGGNIVAQGTPEQVAETKDSYTGNFLKDKLNIK